MTRTLADLPLADLPVMVALPVLMALATPLADTLSTDGFEDRQVNALFVAWVGTTVALRRAVLPILTVSVALFALMDATATLSSHWMDRLGHQSRLGSRRAAMSREYR
jgi:NhaP-type Na+/H+ and K+/H+ antiporter